MKLCSRATAEVEPGSQEHKHLARQQESPEVQTDTCCPEQQAICLGRGWGSQVRDRNQKVQPCLRTLGRRHTRYWRTSSTRTWLPGGSSVHGILQARILGWVAISFSRGSSRPREQTHTSRTSPALAGRFFTTSTTWKQTMGPQSVGHA